MRKIVVFISSLILGANLYAVTLGDIRADVRYNILDSTVTNNHPKYTDAFLNYRINQSAKEIARACYPLYDSQLINAVTGQMEYTVSSGTLKIDKVDFLINSSTGSYRKLIRSTIQSLDNDKGVLWEALPPGLPTNFYQRANVVGLVPPPSSFYANSNAIKIYYYKEIDDMVLDTDQPWNGIYTMQNYVSVLVYSVTWKCKKDKGTAWQDDYKLYMDGLIKMQNDLNATRTDSTVIPVIK